MDQFLGRNPARTGMYRDIDEDGDYISSTQIDQKNKLATELLNMLKIRKD